MTQNDMNVIKKLMKEFSGPTGTSHTIVSADKGVDEVLKTSSLPVEIWFLILLETKVGSLDQLSSLFSTFNQLPLIEISSDLNDAGMKVVNHGTSTTVADVIVESNNPKEDIAKAVKIFKAYGLKVQVLMMASDRRFWIGV